MEGAPPWGRRRGAGAVAAVGAWGRDEGDVRSQLRFLQNGALFARVDGFGLKAKPRNSVRAYSHNLG
jgi:hypothetical protein